MGCSAGVLGLQAELALHCAARQEQHPACHHVRLSTAGPCVPAQHQPLTVDLHVQGLHPGGCAPLQNDDCTVPARADGASVQGQYPPFSTPGRPQQCRSRIW